MKRCVFVFLIVFVVSDAWAVGAPPEFVREWGSLGSGDGQFAGAHGIEVDADGNVYVADTGNHRIQKFTSEGVFIMTWGSLGSGPGQFNHPHGIGIDPMGNVYVAETSNNRVQKFMSDGTFITMWGSFGDGDGQFRHNHGLAVDSNGNVYVTDRDQNRVQKFTNDGVFVMAWGTTGTGDGQFERTTGVAVDGDDNVFVGDTSPRIQKFTSDGVFITSWGSSGNGGGQFDYPRGLATDDMGNLYVADRTRLFDLPRMQKFTGTGQLLAIWGERGAGEGQFELPYAIRPGADGLVYVSDSSNFRVQVFQFPQPEVPATSDWGMVALTLLVLTAGTVVLTRARARRFGVAPASSRCLGFGHFPSITHPG